MKKRANINDVVVETMNEFGEARIHCRLGEIMENIGVNITELADLTGIRYVSIHELVHNKKVTFNMQHLLAIMVALRISDISDLLQIQFEDKEREEEFKKESIDVHDKMRGLPDYVVARRKVNKERVLEWKEEYKKSLES